MPSVTNPEYQRNYRRKHPDRARKYRRTLVDKRLDVIKAAKDKPCKDCGMRYPHYVMDFDHVRGVKVMNVSRLRISSMAKLTNEIAKCDVVCSNCHRIRTAVQLGY